MPEVEYEALPLSGETPRSPQESQREEVTVDLVGVVPREAAGETENVEIKIR